VTPLACLDPAPDTDAERVQQSRHRAATIARPRRHLRTRLTGPAQNPERGSVLVWFVLTAPVLLALVVLVFDGGAKMKASEQAGFYSAEAARAAAVAVGPHGQGGAADTQLAEAAANAYLSAAGVHGVTTVTGPSTVTVTVTVSRTGPISGVSFSVTRSATARLLVGVTNGPAP
jgi:Flp pilus assembly protein TadG